MCVCVSASVTRTFVHACPCVCMSCVCLQINARGHVVHSGTQDVQRGGMDSVDGDCSESEGKQALNVERKRTYGNELRVTLHHCNQILYTVRKCNN